MSMLLLAVLLLCFIAYAIPESLSGDHPIAIYFPVHYFYNNFDFTEAAYSSSLTSSTRANAKGWANYSKSQDQEDMWLYENMFYGKQNGTILESGAADGLFFSNTYMFEKYLGWHSVHIEADPSNYHNLKGNRPHSINIHAALCEKHQLYHYVNTGLEFVRGIFEFMSDKFIRQWHKELLADKTLISRLPVVNCVPIKNILKRLNIRVIDVWILDTEGAEESVLRGTDFNQVRFNFICMECDATDPSKNKNKVAIIEKNNFTCKLLERNCLCKNNEYKPSALERSQQSEFKTWGYSAKTKAQGNYIPYTSQISFD
jgi:FkbM family methyltransferase